MLFSLLFVACLSGFPMDMKSDFPENPDHDSDGDGLTENEGDCDDTNPLVFAGADEL